MTRRRLWSARLAALAAVFGGAVYLQWRGGQVAQLGTPSAATATRSRSSRSSACSVSDVVNEPLRRGAR